jgi:hypothetical protein
MLTRIASDSVGENRFTVAGTLGKAKLVTKLDVVGEPVLNANRSTGTINRTG